MKSNDKQMQVDKVYNIAFAVDPSINTVGVMSYAERYDLILGNADQYDIAHPSTYQCARMTEPIDSRFILPPLSYQEELLSN